MGFVDGTNIYAYVTQNPWTKFDPLGLESKQEKQWAQRAANKDAGAEKRVGAALMAGLESLNFFRKDSSIRDAGRMWGKGLDRANQTLDREAPRGVREFTKIMMGAANASNIVTAGAGVGELADSVREQGPVQTAKNVATNLYDHATSNPSMFAGEVGVGALWGKAGLSGANSPKKSVFWSGDGARAAAETFAKQTGGKTLEITFTGQLLDAITTKHTYYLVKPFWDMASSNFAKNAKGPVDVFHSSKGGAFKVFGQLKNILS